MRESAKTLIFLHLPRTGGTTVEGVIKWEFRHQTQRILQLGPEEPMEDFLSRLAGMHHPPLVVMGHLRYGTHDHIPRESVYFTFLRHPVARVLSEYRWIIRDRPHPLHKRFAEKSGSAGLEEYLHSPDTKHYVENTQVRFLAPVPGTMDVTRDHLELAKKNIAKFVLAGITERFDESFLLLRRALGWRTRLYITRNVSPAATRQTDISDGTIELLAQRNALDLELYEFASRLLDRAIVRQGVSFQRELAIFGALHKPANALGQRASGLIRAYARSKLVGKL